MWKSTLDIADLHAAFRTGEKTIQEIAAQVVIRFKRNKFATDDLSAEDVLNQFERVAEDSNATVEDYDDVLVELYDFADREHRIWVNGS